MDQDQLKARVFESLDHARQNGYDNFLTLPAQEVADDLAEYDADLEDEDPAVLAPIVTAWRVARGFLAIEDA